jgi:hypothetical protein
MRPSGTHIAVLNQYSINILPRPAGFLKLPFQIGVAASRFVKSLVKISKSGSHLLMDDCPINPQFIC